jgi:hypothetical protein
MNGKLGDDLDLAKFGDVGKFRILRLVRFKMLDYAPQLDNSHVFRAY